MTTKWKVVEVGPGLTVASGECTDDRFSDGVSEAMHYATQYALDGPVSVSVKNATGSSMTIKEMRATVLSQTTANTDSEEQ